MESLAKNIEELRQQDLRQAAEVKVTMDESPLKQKVESQVQEVTGVLGLGYYNVSRAVEESEWRTREAYMHENEYYDKQKWDKLYSNGTERPEDFRWKMYKKEQELEQNLE